MRDDKVTIAKGIGILLMVGRHTGYGKPVYSDVPHASFFLYERLLL